MGMLQDLGCKLWFAVAFAAAEAQSKLGFTLVFQIKFAKASNKKVPQKRPLI